MKREERRPLPGDGLARGRVAAERCGVDAGEPHASERLLALAHAGEYLAVVVGEAARARNGRR
jgi:hypothetical protein